MATNKHSGDIKTFEQLGLHPTLAKKCRKLGMDKPTPVQINCIPKIMKGSDCFGCALTGSGKTAAYVLPIVSELLIETRRYFALVLVPTRELAHQASACIKHICKDFGITSISIVGGEDYLKQGRELTYDCQFIIATPGRLVQHIENEPELISNVKYVVFDEADRLLDDLFSEDLEKIVSILPPSRQVLLFSATMSDNLRNFLKISNKKPFVWISEDIYATPEKLDQRFVRAPAHLKDAYLVHVLDDYVKENPRASVIIFTITCKYAHILYTMLNRLNIPCVALHAVMSQKMRNDALSKFKSFHARIMIATNLASRGLDFPTVNLVINHNVPREPEVYVHRVGRTARAGKCGLAITLVTPFDVLLQKTIEDTIRTKLTEHEVNEKEVAKIALEVDHLRSEAEINVDTMGFGERKEINKHKRALTLEGTQKRGKKRKRCEDKNV